MSLLDSLGALLAHFEADVPHNASVMPAITNRTWGELVAVAGQALGDFSTVERDAAQVVKDVLANVVQELPGAALTTVQFAAGDWQRLRGAHAAATGAPVVGVGASPSALSSAAGGDGAPAVVPHNDGPSAPPSDPAAKDVPQETHETPSDPAPLA
jgi:hypothetical protein